MHSLTESHSARMGGREGARPTMKQTIRLRGISGDVKGKTWEHDTLLRAGRLATLEIVLDDGSVSRKHAEIQRTETGWWVRDLESTNGTYVNGVRLTNTNERQLHSRDIVQFGKVAMMVELSDNTPQERLPTEGGEIQLTLPTSSWEDGFARVFLNEGDKRLQAGDQLLALLRAGRHLVSIEDESELLHSILEDSVKVLDAQRGAIVLAEGPENQLHLKSVANGRNESGGRFYYSKKMANRCFNKGESILCTSVEEDQELKNQQSIAEGTMASVMCVLLRTPRKRLGVLHLDRSYWQKAFTEQDLHLADALAAHVSAGIECAQLYKKQQDLFLHTITILAQAVELRDEYTGGHTIRVTNYSLLLAQHLKLSNDDIRLLRMGTPLHDIGKIGIDDAILRKPDRLTPEEFAIMQTHTVKGAHIIATIPDLKPVLPIVRSHHERWDGKGYPDRLAGENIPLLARIVAVADAFDAMTSNRPYHKDKKGYPPEYAFEEVRKMSGMQFDPTCAKAFLEIRHQIVESMSANKQTSFMLLG
jgi:HD-GYP domain-containing protein (c-di-GMP phosphodiesterase class II)